MRISQARRGAARVYKRSARVLAISVSATHKHTIAQLVSKVIVSRALWYSLKQVALRLVKVRHRFRPAPFARSRSLLYHPPFPLTSSHRFTISLLVFPLRTPNRRPLPPSPVLARRPSPSLSFCRSNRVPHSIRPHPTPPS